jgi:WD40 repeat protein
MQARTTTSVIPILLLSLIFLLFSVRADAETKLPIAVVPNIGDPSDVGHAIFSPNGQLLATSDTLNSANSITLWDIASARPLRRLEHYAYFTAFSFTPDSALIASAHKDGTVNLWMWQPAPSLRL